MSLNVVFSASITDDIFEKRNVLTGIEIPTEFKLSLIYLALKKNVIFLKVVGKTDLYNKKILNKIKYEQDNSNIIYEVKNKIISIVNHEILETKSDISFLNELLPRLILYKNKSKDLIEKKIGTTDLKRFLNIMSKTYRNTYKMTEGIYENLIWKPYYTV